MVQRGAANVTQDPGELLGFKRCNELATLCMVKRKLRMGFESASTVWEQGQEERLLEQLWLVELVLLSRVLCLMLTSLTCD